ncbi:MAG: YitT family protein [Caldicoprobacter sp.]|uniref:YitT family protein n=1 Tax=Caldicoprobacter sp. TaxID=2004500 RepID=UPI001D2544AE|nr:hypothetical protein [Clostridia bacterium]
MMGSKTGRLFIRVFYIIIGSFIYSLGVNMLLVPHKLLSGGLTGIAIILEYLFSIPKEITVIIFNVPLFIGGYRFLGKRFIYLSLLGIASMSAFLYLTKGWTIDVKDDMIAAIFGGLILGTGAGIVMRNRGSLGGTDIISLLVNKFFSFSVGWVATACNFIILSAAAFLLNVETAMFSMVGIFVSNKAVDAILTGFNHKKTVIIVSDKAEDMAQELFRHVKRGITFLNGQGAYTHKDKKLIYMVVRTMELSKLREVVHRVDPGAFMSIIDTREVQGKGFSVEDII